MKIEEICCSLELAKRLKELGLKQESLFYWTLTNSIYKLTWIIDDGGITDKICPLNSYSAFSAAELADIIPNAVQTQQGDPFDNFRIKITKFYSIDLSMNKINNFIVNYDCDTTEASGGNAWLNRQLTRNIYDNNLANAMAKMLVFLIENKLMELPN